MRVTGSRVRASVMAVVALASAGAANANLTTVRPPYGSEATHAQIFTHVYGAFGGAFNGAAGPGASSYTNGTVTATRVDDYFSGGPGNPLNLVTGAPGGSSSDQQWVDGIAVTSAEAKFAAFSQQFGYDEGGGYVKLFDVTMTGPTGFDVAGTGAHHFSLGVPWNWVRSGQGGTFYSQSWRNKDKLDHMVTYQITGLPGLDPGETVWMLFFEDLRGSFSAGTSDRDFNDLGVEVRASVAVVPAPSAAALGALGLGLVGLFRRRRIP